MTAYFFDTAVRWSNATRRRPARPGCKPWLRIITSIYLALLAWLARITEVEVIAAITRRKRSGTLLPADAATAIANFRSHLGVEYAVIDISRLLIRRAADLAEQHGLRAYDAVQLACATQVQNERRACGMAGLILVSADLALNAAARAEGLIVADPNTP